MIEPPQWYKYDVSRETIHALNEYSRLVRKWTGKINLVAASTLNDMETRHIWDSAQAYAQRNGTWADLGSGGGLPGIVIAILRKGDALTEPVYLVESDQRKATFLRTCIRELDLNAQVVAQRIETTEPLSANTVSARALTNLRDLVPLAQRHLAPGGECIFLKGARWVEEISEAQTVWRFSYDASSSKTNPAAAVVRIRDIERV